MAGERKNSFDFVFELPKEEKKSISKHHSTHTNTPVKTEVESYLYVFSEAKNTLIIATLITAINLVLFIALKQNFINLFGLEF